MREPLPLRSGAHIALVSPSGPLNGPHELQHAVEAAEAFGWTVTVGTHALSRSGYFAGDDAQRGGDLLRAIADDTIDGIWCLRGGYGSARLLPQLDASLRQSRPKALIGYSDITALHALWQTAGLVSYHGPTARTPLSPFTRASLLEAVQVAQDATLHATNAEVIRGGRANGRLAGGNLAVAASLCGTPWAPQYRGAIVVLEDINEATYRLDRMLTQLRLSGAFDGCVGLALGHFTDCPDTTADGTRALAAIVEELAGELHVPTLLGVPIGHIVDQWTLPFGACATLDADARSLHLHRT